MYETLHSMKQLYALQLSHFSIKSRSLYKLGAGVHYKSVRAIIQSNIDLSFSILNTFYPRITN